MSNTQLIPLVEVNAAELFDPSKNTLEELIVSITDATASLVPDVSTDKGRKEIASVAYNVARSKTTIDNAGKEFASDLKAKVKSIDQQRKYARDKLDALKDRIRKPLDEYEEAERQRIQGHTDVIARIKEQADDALDSYMEYSVDDLQEIRADIELINPEQFEEFEDRAESAKQYARDVLDTAIERADKYHTEQAELEQFRKEKAEREEREAEERREREQKEREQRIADQAAERERVAARKREEQLIREKEEAEQKAERQAQQEAAERERRERNTKHRGKCNREAVAAIVKASGCSDDQAKSIVTAIAKGEIPRVVINY